jgi:hypothetical protein
MKVKNWYSWTNRIAIIFLLVLFAMTLVSMFRQTRINNEKKNYNNYSVRSKDPLLKKEFCDISSDVNKQKKCQSNEDCAQCIGGVHLCYEVDNNSSNSELHYRYKMQDGNRTHDIPKGKWCLPAKPTKGKDSPNCNLFSGTPSLTLGKDNTVAWTCHCKYPNLFQNSGLYGDCNYEVACGSELNRGHLVAPKNGLKTLTSTIKAGERWIDNPTWDPTLGTCSCSQEGFQAKHDDVLPSNQDEKRYATLSCVKEGCYPGRDDPHDDSLCDCRYIKGGSPWDDNLKKYIPDKDKGYVTYVSTKVAGLSPICTRDPCNPGGYKSDGNLDTDNRCVCDFGQINDDPNTAFSKPGNGEALGYPSGQFCLTPCLQHRQTALEESKKKGKKISIDVGDPLCGGRGVCIDRFDTSTGTNIKRRAWSECTSCNPPYVQSQDKLCNKKLSWIYGNCDHDGDCYGSLVCKHRLTGKFQIKKMCVDPQGQDWNDPLMAMANFSSNIPQIIGPNTSTPPSIAQTMSPNASLAYNSDDNSTDPNVRRKRMIASAIAAVEFGAPVVLDAT